MAEEDYIKAPTSRLDANTVASSRAMDAGRRAVSDQRQGMAVERMLQRKWKRAVRKDDYGAMAAIGNEMKGMGLSRIGKGGIQSSEQNDLEAFRRAETARRTGNRAAKEMDAILGPDGEEPAKAGEAPPKEDAGAAIEKNVANDRASADAGYGRPAGTPSDPSSRLLPENNPAPSSALAGKPKWQPDSRKQFIADLEKSDSFKRGDPEAIERAAKRGAKYGISKEQLMLRASGQNSRPSDVAKALEVDRQNESNPDILKPEPSKTVKKDMRIRGFDLQSISGDILDREIATFDSQAKTRRLLGRDEMQPSPDPDFSESRALVAKKKADKKLAAQEKKLGDKEANIRNSKAQQEADYWNVDPASITSGISTANIVDRSDPRYEAMKIKEESFNEASRLKYTAGSFFDTIHGRASADQLNKNSQNYINDARQKMVSKAIERGVDISGFTKQDPEWHAQYQSAREDDQKIKSAMASLQETQSKYNDMASSFR